MLKKYLSIAVAVLLIFAFTACGSSTAASSASTSSATNAQQQQGQPEDDGSIRGIVTTISDTQIEIAKMTGGGQGGDGQTPPSGNAPSGTPSASGSAPSGTPSASGSAPQTFMDTSNMEKVQYTINSSTKIVKQTALGNSTDTQSSGQQATESEASISDITAGTMVSITLQDGSDTIAAKIVITQGMGGGQGGPQGGQGAPQGGGAQPSASGSPS
jgi:hypothetical protein